MPVSLGYKWHFQLINPMPFCMLSMTDFMASSHTATRLVHVCGSVQHDHLPLNTGAFYSLLPRPGTPIQSLSPLIARAIKILPYLAPTKDQVIQVYITWCLVWHLLRIFSLICDASPVCEVLLSAEDVIDRSNSNDPLGLVEYYTWSVYGQIQLPWTNISLSQTKEFKHFHAGAVLAEVVHIGKEKCDATK